MFVIIGGNGFLGSYLVKNILDKTNDRIIASYNSGIPFCENERIIWQKLDVTNVESVSDFAGLIQKHKGSDNVKCVYLAGYIKPDDVERNPQLSWEINIFGLSNVLNQCSHLFDNFIFTSTDMAAGESIGEYKFKETDYAEPVNLYGQTKFACERIVLAAGFTVVRLPLMIGKSLIPNRPHFIEHIESVIAKQEVFEILADYYESSLDYNTVANLILGLLKLDSSQIKTELIHIAADNKISKYEIACRYAKKHNLDTSYLKPISLKDAHFFIAKRCDILMDNTKLKNFLKIDKIEINEG